MFININKGKMFSKWVENFTEQGNRVFISFISKHFFHKLETFETSYLSIINCMQLFSIFSIFLFLLILFKFVPLWIAIYQLGYHWLCFISAFDYVEIVIFKERKKIQLVNTLLFSVLIAVLTHFHVTLSFLQYNKTLTFLILF